MSSLYRYLTSKRLIFYRNQALFLHSLWKIDYYIILSLETKCLETCDWDRIASKRSKSSCNSNRYIVFFCYLSKQLIAKRGPKVISFVYLKDKSIHPISILRKRPQKNILRYDYLIRCEALGIHVVSLGNKWVWTMNSPFPWMFWTFYWHFYYFYFNCKIFEIILLGIN